MASVPFCVDILDSSIPTKTLGEVSDLLGVSNSKVLTLVSNNSLLALRRNKEILIPAQFFDDEGIAKHVTGLIGVLLDGGYTHDEALEWIFREQDDLGLTPAQALHTDRAREVIRRAQALGF